MTARIIDLSVIRARKAQEALPHHGTDAPLFDSTPTGLEVAFAAEEAEYFRLAGRDCEGE